MPGLFAKWWIYQRERFPVLAHGPLIASFSGSAVAYSALLTGRLQVPWPAWVAAFVVCFVFFLQLRIADEFKDADDDRRFRPYRPVPRGLVRLRELALVFAVGAALQLAAAWWRHPPLAWVLVAAWCYLGLMSVEFFARDWLKARPITYLWTHMFIMPIVDFFATACQWMPDGHKPGLGLAWFLAASYANGLVIEVGRKIRRAEDEETGVETYSRLWGLSRAVVVWWGCLAAVVVFATVAASFVGHALAVGSVLAGGFLLVVAATAPMRAGTLHGKRLEALAGAWTLLLYFSLGLVPWLWKMLG